MNLVSYKVFFKGLIQSESNKTKYLKDKETYFLKCQLTISQKFISYKIRKYYKKYLKINNEIHFPYRNTPRELNLKVQGNAHISHHIPSEHIFQL